MATGRTLGHFARIYIDGYDLSGFTRSIGECDWSMQEADQGTVLTDAVTGALPGAAIIRTGDISANYDNTATTGLHVMAKAASGTLRNIMIPFGIRAAPAAGDECWVAQNEQLNYMVNEIGDGSVVAATLKHSKWSARGDTLLYKNPWGNLIHPLGAETAVNSSTADHDYGAQTTKGGYMMYHVTAGNGTCTIKVQDADTNLDGSFGDLLTSGEIDASAAPLSGVVALGTTATVERYTRWQIALNTATTVTFVLAFVRRIQ